MTTNTIQQQFIRIDHLLSAMEQRLDIRLPLLPATPLQAAFELQENNLISFQSLSQVEPGRWFLLADRIYALRLPHRHEGEMKFVVSMPPDSRLAIHHHDCQEELILLSGGLRLNGKLVQQSIVIPAGEEHEVWSEGGSLFLMEFFLG